jgi:hypothetical protein
MISALAIFAPHWHIASMAETNRPPAGWFVHVKTFDAEDTPVVTRHFYVAEPNRTRAEEIAAELGETAEAIHPLSQRDLDELKLAAGQKKEHDYDR